MPAGTILVLPDPAGAGAHALDVLLDGAGPRGDDGAGPWQVRVLDPVDGERAATRAAGAIAALDPDPPLVIVACGSAALLLPAVALAQRAAHRRVVAYLLLEADPPPTDDAWPDAPVFTAGDAPAARLRGWTEVDDLAAWTPPVP